MATDAHRAEAPAPAPAPKPRKASSRTKSERKLAWMLCAPAVVVMLAVTAYPIVYAFVLSLQKLDLRFPEQTEFIGFANYGTVLSSELWWLDVWNTFVIMVISVSIGFASAWRSRSSCTGRSSVAASSAPSS